MKVALVTGGTSGIGLATAQALHDAGCRVYTCARRETCGGAWTHFSCDVTRQEQVRDMVERIMAREGKIDLAVNAAGFGISGAVEYTETEAARRLMDVNFFGMVTVNRELLPIFHRQGFGRIVNISSVASPVAIPFQTFYSASKAAIDAYTRALATEVRPYGITVCAVQPGDIATGFTAAREKSELGDDAYGGRISRSVSVMERDERGGMRPELAGKAIAAIALKKRVKPIYVIGLKYKLAAALVKLLPLRWVDAIVGKIYG